MKFLTIFLLAMMAGLNLVADIVLDDPFDNGDLSTYTNGLNGGVNVIGSGGAASEDGSAEKATISNAANGSQFGILSGGTVSLNGAPTLRTTWAISDGSLKNNAESLVFTWQLGTVLDESPSISLVLDVQNSEVHILTSGVTNSSVEVDVDFGATNHQFSVITELSLDRIDVTGTGDLKNRDAGSGTVSFGYDWSISPPSTDNIYVGAYVNAKSNNGLVVEFDSVTVETIPEPAVISLIGLFGGGMIFSRRIFGRKKSESNA